MPRLFHTTIASALLAIYDGETPICAAVFFSATRALTNYRTVSPTLGAVLIGRSQPADEFPLREWTFRVVAVSPGDDLVVLEIASGPPATHFLPPVTPGDKDDINKLVFTGAWLATFGLEATASMPTGEFVDRYAERLLIGGCGARHIAYGTHYAGAAGGAVFNAFGTLVGLHLGGWRTDAKKQAAVKAAPAARVKKLSVAQMPPLPTGGFAVYLGTPAIAALLTAAAPTLAEGAGACVRPAGGSPSDKAAAAAAHPAAGGGGRGRAAKRARVESAAERVE